MINLLDMQILRFSTFDKTIIWELVNNFQKNQNVN